MMISHPIDRLRVFVSSTIKECAEERGVARAAIRSINLEPILFEDIGARPHPPRDVYKPRLEMSHIFVGVYKASYGWVAPDMDISGIEDEFNIASDRGIDRLIYYYVGDARVPRDEELEALIVRAKNSGITVATYSDPKDLRERIRNDVTAVVSSRFADQVVVSYQAPKAEELLDSLLPNAAHRFRRLSVERMVLQALRNNDRVIITGPFGAGKTVLLAQLANELDWIFVDGAGLSNFELLVRTADAVRARLGLGRLTLTTEEAARRELFRAWGTLTNQTLAVDAPIELLSLCELPTEANRKLVLTSRRSHVDVSAGQHLDLPPLTNDEIRTWVTTLRGRDPNPTDLIKMSATSNGSPLYLRFYSLGQAAPEDLSLRDLEVQAFAALTPRSRELISYLVIYGRPLSLGDVEKLLGLEDGPQAALDCVAASATLLRETKGYIEVVHEHPRRTILESLHESATRLTFFASRLGRYFEESGRYVAAFHVYSEGEEHRSADRVLDQASTQALLLGGGAPAVPILKRQIERARALGQTKGQVGRLLALAYVLKQVGARDEAGRMLLEAEDAASNEGDDWQLLSVEEMILVLDLKETPRAERIRKLAALRVSYAKLDDAFSAARIETILTTEYISASDYPSAERIARETLSFFSSIGDEYGSRIARVNLATSLSGQEGREQEAAGIVLKLEEEFEPNEYPRERAVLCNFLTRHYRRIGNTALAADFAKEAIGIGEQLQDYHIITMNRGNLGNVFRDELKLDLALNEYRIAEQCALTSGIREDEGIANELIASVLSTQEKYSPALHHAKYALAIARELGNMMLTARASEEIGIALRGQRELDAAVIAYTDAARAIASFPPAAYFFASLVEDALSICAASEDVGLKARLLTSLFLSGDAEPKEQDALSILFRALPEMARRFEPHRLVPIVALTVGDLFAEARPVIERRVILQLADTLLSGRRPDEAESAMAAMAAILMAQSGNCLTLGDVCDLAESVAAISPSIYFKPHNDGASHWTVRLAIGNGVIVTVTQLDDDAGTAVTTLAIALLLSSQLRTIRRYLLDTERFPRNEAVIQLISRMDFEHHISADLASIGDMSMGFVVAETSDVTRADQPPIVAICGDDFGIPWRPSEHALSDIHLLLGRILRVFVAHLLGRAIEFDVLSPKIREVIRAIGYGGRAPKVHARFALTDVGDDNHDP